MHTPHPNAGDQPAPAPRLTYLLAPLGVETFFHTYWERACVYIGRKAASYYDSLLTVRDLDDHLQRQNLHPSFVKVLKDGVSYAPEQWTTLQQRQQTDPYRVIAVEELLACYNAGATVVLNAAETALPALAAWCGALGYELTSPLQANIYITPPQSRGSVPHYDTHNVLVLQISGRKQWRVYDIPEPWPVKEQLFPAEAYAVRPPAQHYELQAGDLLYLPRGLVHDAYTTDTPSIHVTLGLQTDCWFHLLEELAVLAQDEPAMRQALPHGLSSQADNTRFAEQFRQKLQALIAGVDPAMLLERRHAAFVRHQMIDRRARFTDVLHVAQLTLDTVVSRRPHVHYLIEQSAQSVELTFAQKVLSLPRFLLPAVAFLCHDRPFAVRELPGLLSEAGKLELVKRFVSAGFLTVTSSQAP